MSRPQDEPFASGYHADLLADDDGDGWLWPASAVAALLLLGAAIGAGIMLVAEGWSCAG